jgi:hypothetical protein
VVCECISVVSGVSGGLEIGGLTRDELTKLTHEQHYKTKQKISSWYLQNQIGKGQVY